MGKGAPASSSSVNESVLKKILLSYFYVVVWIFLNFTVIVYNKYILDRKMYNWPFPILLTMIHMAFCSSLPTSSSSNQFLYRARSISPPSSPSVLSTLSASSFRMLKALLLVVVYSIGVLFKKDSFKSNTMANMLSISFCVVIAAYREAKFDSWGVTLQLGAVIFEATRLVMIQFLLTSKENLSITIPPPQR